MKKSVWFGLVLLLGAPLFALAQAPDFYQEPGLSPNRNYVNQTGTEHIDPFTGRLQFHNVDLFIPGNGGLDIKIERSYNNLHMGQSVGYASTLYEIAFGLGWTIHFGRVWKAGSTSNVCDTSPLGTSGMPVLELPDGSRQILARDDKYFTGGFVSTQFWRAKCAANGGLIVYSPNGLRYDVTQFGSAPQGTQAYLTSRITDRNGNYLSISYINISGYVVPQTVSASDGRTVQFSYTGTGLDTRLTSISSSGRTWTYGYKKVSGYWLLTKVTPPKGGAWQYSYKETAVAGEAGLYSIIKMTHPYGGTASYAYDWKTFNGGAPGAVSSTVVKSKTASTGGSWTYTYAPSTGGNNNDKTTVSTPIGTFIYEHVGYYTVGQGDYWRFGLLVSKKTSSEQTELYDWVPHQVSNQTNVRSGGTLAFDNGVFAPIMSRKRIIRDGNTYTTDYSNFDDYGNPRTINESSSGFSRSTALTYKINTSLWLIRQVEDESFGGFSINRTIDSYGNLTSIDHFGKVTDFTYYSDGTVSTQKDARNKTITYSDYYRGIPRSESYPDGTHVSRSVSYAGNVISQTDGKGDTTGWDYDDLNRITAINFPRGADMSISWGSTSTTYTRGSLSQTVSLNGFGSPMGVTSSDSVSPSQNYSISINRDALERKTFQSYPGTSKGTSFNFDMLDRVSKITHGDSTFRTYTYSATTVKVSNERSNTQIFSYRAYGNPDQRDLMGIAVTTANASIGITRNPIGQIKNVSQGGLTRTYGYNGSNFLTSIDDPETGTTVFGRDSVGNMTSRQVGASPITYFSYDDMNRLETVTYPIVTDNVVYSYYGDGKVKEVTNGTASRHFEYDGNKNLTRDILSIDGATHDTLYAYGANDGLDSATYPSGTVVSFASDGRGRPTQAAPFLTGVAFHPGGELKSLSYANGVTTSISLNSRQWPQRMTSIRSASTLVDINYTYDGLGNITRFDDFLDSSNTIPILTYDEIDRLVKADTSSEVRRFAYDGVGNFVSRTLGGTTLTYTYVNNRLQSISGGSALQNYSFSYDVYGNVAHNGRTSFVYNDASQLTCARCDNPIQYAYDGRGERVRTSNNGVLTYSIYGQDNNLLEEVTRNPASGSVQTRDFIYVAGKQVAVKTSEQTSPTLQGSSSLFASGTQSGLSLSVNVAGASLTGTVTFLEGSVVLGTAKVVNGRATLSLVGLSEGTHTITAEYSGDANNAANSITLTASVTDQNRLPVVLHLLLND